MQSLELKDNYVELINSENSHPYFLGLIESTTNTGKIGRVFVYGIEGTTPFCLEGYDDTKRLYNKRILNAVFSICNGSESNESDFMCKGSVTGGYIYSYSDGRVAVFGIGDDTGSCGVNRLGSAGCSTH